MAETFRLRTDCRFLVGVPNEKSRIGIERHDNFSSMFRNTHVFHCGFDGSKGNSVKSFAPINKECVERRSLTFENFQEMADDKNGLNGGAILSKATLPISGSTVQGAF